jgi:hypothetical protein
MKPNDFQDLDRQYEAAKQQWQQEHPEATPQEYEQAIRAIAQRLGY